MEAEIKKYREKYRKSFKDDDETLEFKALLRQLGVIMVISYGRFLLSLELGFSGFVIPEMENDAQIACSDFDLKWMLAMLLLGSAVGPQSAHLSQSYGWKPVYMSSLAVSSLSWTILSGVNYCGFIFILRFINGICHGVQSLALLHYCHECTSSHHALYICIVTTMSTTSGYLIFALVHMSSSWRILALGAALASAIQMVLMAVLPNTPFFLYRKYGWQASIDAFHWLFVKSEESFEKFRDMRNTFNDKENSRPVMSVRESLNKVLKLRKYHPVKDSVLLYIGHELTGLNIFFGFLMTIMLEFKMETRRAQLTCVGIMMIYTIQAQITSRLALCTSRRDLLSYSSRSISLLMFILGKIFIIKALNIEITKTIACVLIVVSISYVLVYSSGWNLVPDCFFIEATNLANVREGAWIHTVRWSIAFLVTSVTLILYSNFGIISLTISFCIFSHILNFIHDKLKYQMPDSRKKSYLSLRFYYDEVNREE